GAPIGSRPAAYSHDDPTIHNVHSMPAANNTSNREREWQATKSVTEGRSCLLKLKRSACMKSFTYNFLPK
ncbi:MAG: hypothetical protein ACRD4Q_13055, partial [Candidatus Acidiferrales bacterium]